jgi:hypothetical protein
LKVKAADAKTSKSVTPTPKATSSVTFSDAQAERRHYFEVILNSVIDEKSKKYSE